jgi:diguanylate cyclase
MRSLDGQQVSEDLSGRKSTMREARSELLNNISSFLLDHDLEVTATNLVLVHGALSGENRRLARAIVARVNAGEAVTQHWLEEATSVGATGEDEHRDVDALIEKVEAALEAFSGTTSSIRQAVSNYGDALEQQVSEMTKIDEAEHLVASLTALTRAMLTRTRKVEDEMRQREDETKILRRRLESAKRDAEVDYLTGLPNRRAFEALLDRHYKEAREAIEHLVVAFCDIDNFKRINDTYGHEVGDRVLKVIAEALAQIADNNCHLARYGGEEFVMLFRNIAPEEARKRFDDARQELAKRRWIHRATDSQVGQITFSGGIADVFAYTNTREALRAADEALYLAKEGGRNQIVVASSG